MFEEKDLYVYQDRGGRFYIGYLEEELVDSEAITLNTNNKTVILNKVLIIQEHRLSSQDNKPQIMLNLSPLMHTFNIDTWEFQWIGKHKVIDPQLVNAYERFWTQIRAARSGISTASSIPSELASSLAPEIAREI